MTRRLVGILISGLVATVMIATVPVSAGAVSTGDRSTVTQDANAQADCHVTQGTDAEHGHGVAIADHAVFHDQMGESGSMRVASVPTMGWTRWDAAR